LIYCEFLRIHGHPHFFGGRTALWSSAILNLFRARLGGELSTGEAVLSISATEEAIAESWPVGNKHASPPDRAKIKSQYQDAETWNVHAGCLAPGTNLVSSQDEQGAWASCIRDLPGAISLRSLCSCGDHFERIL
jgi:hypothetical protein